MFEPAKAAPANFLQCLLGRGLANLRPGAGRETFGQLKAHLHNSRGARGAESLRVSVGDDEVDPGQAGGDHIVDRVAAGASHAAHHDARLQFFQLGGLQIDRHTLPLSFGARPRRLTLRGLARQGPLFRQHRATKNVRLPPMVASRLEPSPLWLTSA